MTTRTQTRLVCPPELEAALPARPEVPASAGPVQGSPESLAFIGERFAWGDGAAKLFEDAQAACRAERLLRSGDP